MVFNVGLVAALLLGDVPFFDATCGDVFKLM